VIAQVATQRQKTRFLNACRGAPVFETILPLELELFGKTQPGRFFAGPTLALDIGGRTVWAAGHASPDELGGFLSFCGCRAVILNEAVCPVPAGWQRAETLTVFSLAPSAVLPEPAADEVLWASLAYDPSPLPGPVADVLFAGRGKAKWDDFYSELCTKRARGLARVYALKAAGGGIACTVGAYAIRNGQAYLACGQTAEPLRGRGIGGRLIVQTANRLSAEGLRPVFLCSPERVPFYTRLGFDKTGELARCEKKQEGICYDSTG